MNAVLRHIGRALRAADSQAQSVNDESEEICLAPTLETERLWLRSLRSADFNDYAALYSDPEVLRYLTGAGGQPWDRGRAWRHLSFVRGHWL